MVISEVTTPDVDSINQLKSGLISYNAPFTEGLLDETIASFIRDSSGVVIGGVLAKLCWGWLYIEWLWLDESIRHSGMGSKLLEKIEHYALANGVRRFRLETASFQALEFYTKSGYEVFGVLDDMPPGHKNYFLKKVV